MTKISFVACLTLFMLAGALYPNLIQAAPPLQPTRPTVVISAPRNGQVFGLGDTIHINSSSDAAALISRVEFFVNGNAVAYNTTGNPYKASPMVALQEWRHVNLQGNLTITVRATAFDGNQGEASVNINVGATQPTCYNDASFIQYVSASDASPILPGAMFARTWQVQNTGTCAWNSNYFLANVGGDLIASTGSSVPAARPGDGKLVSVNLTAPRQPGSYITYWRLVTPNGTPFGPVLNAQFVVGQAGCNGIPTISRFVASPSTIQRGQYSTLEWNVSGADHVELQSPDGNQTVSANSSRVVSPQSTTRYTLVALCGGIINPRAITVTIGNPPPVSGNRVEVVSTQDAGNNWLNVRLRYFYNNQPTGAQIRITITNAVGSQVGQQLEPAFVNQEQNRNIFVQINGGIRNAYWVQACLTTPNLIVTCSGLERASE